MAPMDADDLARGRALVEAATPGPWEHFPPDEDGHRWVETLADGGWPVCGLDGYREKGEADAAFIAWARNAVPSLLDAAERAARLEATVARIEREAKPLIAHEPEYQQFADGWAAAMARIAALLQPKGDGDVG